jgi:membrane-associated phospholipid phosphatase
MSFTALLAAYMLDLGRRVKQALWIWLALTFLATIYLGWHYVSDNVAGLMVGATALFLARLLVGSERPAVQAMETRPGRAPRGSPRPRRTGIAS